MRLRGEGRGGVVLYKSNGTFFQAPTGFQCSCLNTDIDADVRWHAAEYMAAVNQDLRAIVAVPFNSDSWCNLPRLQRMLRNQDLYEEFASSRGKFWVRNLPEQI